MLPSPIARSMKNIAKDYLLLTALRDCIVLRNSMNARNISDEIGARRSVDSLLDFLSLQRKYGLSKMLDLKKSWSAERTVGVMSAINTGKAIRVQRVHTMRDWSLSFIDKVNIGFTDDELLTFIDDHYRLILVTLWQSRVLRSEFITGDGLSRFDYIGLKLDSRFVPVFFGDSGLLH